MAIAATTTTHPELAATAQRLGLLLADVDIHTPQGLRKLHATLLHTARHRTQAEQQRLLLAAHYLSEAHAAWADIPTSTATTGNVLDAVQTLTTLVLEDAAAEHGPFDDDTPVSDASVPLDNTMLIRGWLQHLDLHADRTDKDA